MRTASLLLTLSSILFVAADVINPQCEMCLHIAENAKKSGMDSERITKAKALQAANHYDGDEKQLYIDELNCHWPKYYNDANFNPSATTLSTCADTGFCSLSNQKWTIPVVDITNITTSYSTTCVMPVTILIHHTVTNRTQETIDVLLERGLSVQYIVAKNGTVFQMVNDWHGAWHAGNGNWHDLTNNLNTHSIGIEHVSDGASPFTPEQTAASIALVDNLRKRWFIDQTYIIGHCDYAPDRKDDPSGYFPWQQMYTSLNMFPGLYPSHLSSQDQHKVLISNNTLVPSTINRVQAGLRAYGFTRCPMTPNVYDDNMRMNIQSFNRHFCPEVFVKEVEDVQEQTNIMNGLNQQWYGVSDERLVKLLRFVQN